MDLYPKGECALSANGEMVEQMDLEASEVDPNHLSKVL